ncbi:hypothetical protein OK412_08665 [Pantoea sp. JV6]|nr:hypothetical protein [Pantoea sp. JV6]MCW0974375.1 hypothetical protein [Pantoea sp. JV6]
METQIKFVVVGHHSRRHQAEQLAESINAHLLIDECEHGANWNHRRALEWASQQHCRVVILEDDALPVPGFAQKVETWLSRFPNELLSFYLGTGRPPQYQLEIATKLIDADRRQAEHITISRLIHGVCYSVPTHRLEQVLSRWNHRSPADYAVGDAYGGTIVYPCYSLVDHLDSDTVERHPDNTPRTERRRAWRLDSKDHHGTSRNA